MVTDDVSNGGPGWLYRRSDLVLGPVSATQLVEKLYAGELDPASEVQRMGAGSFVPLSQVPEFKVHVAKAEAKRRVDGHAAEHRAAQRTRQLRVGTLALVALAAVGLGVAALGKYLAVHGAGGAGGAQAWGDITIDAPTISKARRSSDDELVDYRGQAKKAPTAVATRAEGATPTTRTPQAHERRSPGADDPEGLSAGEVDEAAINAVVSRHKPTLVHCIREVARPDMPPTKIPIEFAISEEGRVTKVWVDNADFKDTGLQDCLLKELARWPFKAGQSGASVNLSFNVGKRG
jgi:hypothetical protein